MTELIPTINDIVKYGLQPNLIVDDKELILEKGLVKIYNLFFEIQYKFDEIDFPEFDKSLVPDIRHNVQTNFKDFGYYKVVNDLKDIDNLKDHLIGDAVDDLSDIILDLLEIKWRIENNSLADGLWFFELTFDTHTKQHILNLLNFIKQKND